MLRPLHLAPWLAVGVLLVGLAGSAPGQRAGRDAPADPVADEEARERRALERFVSLLERNPRRGTALDRIYGYHVERGTLDELIKSYRDRVARDSKDGAAALILGLLEFQRGQDAAAVAALRRAESARPADPLPSFYLGQALVLVGQPEQATEAFERALARKPARNDLLEIFQALGRVYQRTQKSEQAMAVWSRLETLFPDDTRVQEQIASALAEEDQPAQALPRFEALARKVRDPFRQVQHAMQAAELKVRLNRSEEALKDFEAMLAKLRPDSWLHKEVRGKIEDVFLRNDDRAGLAAYYERWMKRDPDDVEALVRLGRTLSTLGRVAEAQSWYEKAIQRAPGRRDLRLALIGQLAQDQKFAEAAAQYEQLDRSEPGNPDTLKDWGALVLRDPNRPAAGRKAAAAAIWRRMLDARPGDAVTTAQVADLLRQAELVDEALALYRKAGEQAPGNPQYREYLGEYLHQLKRPAEAMAEWARMAEGPGKNVKNLGRLAEVLAGFGYVKEAIGPLEQAVALEKDDFDLRMKLADYLHRLGRFDDAEAQLAAASALADKDERRAAVRESRVANDQAAGRLAARIAAMRRDLEARPDSPADRWVELARYLEADGKLPDAVRAADRAIAVDGRSIPAWTLAARVRETAGNLGDSAEALRRLADVDRKNRAEYLEGIARLESRLGRVDEAIKAGRELLAATAAGPEPCEFFAQLCFQHGRIEEGLDALRRAVRANPRDTRAVLTLAETLATQYQTEEAIEMYWRAFDRAAELDHKLDVVRRITELYLQRNQLDRLLTRLQHQERDDRPGGVQPASQGRDVAMCLAQAYATSGDLGAARSELDRLLAANTRDTQLLAQLSKLAEEEGDVNSAARYQRQLVELAPGDEGLSRLGQLYARSGDIEEAQSVWSKLAGGQGSALHVYMAMDSLIFYQKPAPVLETSEAMLRKAPDDWEALYRRGAAAALTDRREMAEQAFRALLNIKISDDEMSALAKARARNPHLHVPNEYPTLGRIQASSPMELRLGLATPIRWFSGVVSSPIAQSYSWSPGDFGQARMAAFGWLLHMAKESGGKAGEELAASIRATAEKRPADLRAMWDWLYLCAMRFDHPGVFAAARELSRAAPSDPIALWAYLHSLGGRQTAAGQRVASVLQARNVEVAAPPLDRAELEHIVTCFRSLQARRPELVQAEVIQFVDDELKRAKRGDEEERFYGEVVAGATRIGQVAAALNIAARRGDVDGLIDLAERYDRLQAGRSTPTFFNGSFTFAGGPALSISQGMNACADRKAYAEVIRLLDLDLEATRRKMERQSTGASGRAWRARPTSPLAASARRIAQRIWVGNTIRAVSIDFPQANEYLDSDAIMVLRTAFEIYKRDDLLSDLVAHFRSKAEAAAGPAAAAYPRLALSALLWWGDAKDEAITELTKLVEASRPESDLRLDLAELLEQQADFAGSLALLDAVQPLDNMSLRRREEIALRVAVRTGNIDRARQAAERLFGLRLETETQISVAGQMHQLGLHELAEALLGRARRRAGNKGSALVGLMLQYQRQDKLDQAVQVAMQILRTTTETPVSTTTVLRLNADDPAATRQAAIGVLARSGRLSQLIDRANEQLKKAPNAVPIHQALADYYTAARQPAKARAELLKIVELRPENVNLRLQVAGQLAREGQAATAIEHYRFVIKKDPTQLGRLDIGQIAAAFRQAGKLDELLRLMEQGSLLSDRDAYVAVQLLEELMAEERLRERAMAVFVKLWQVAESERVYLLTYLTREEIWQMPQIYEVVRDIVLAKPAPTDPTYAQWYLFRNPRAITATGRPQETTSKVARFLAIAATRGRLDELERQIASTRKERPEWLAGDFLQAMVLCRSGRYDEARQIVQALADPRPNHENLATSIYPMYAYADLGAELESHAEVADLVPAVYERSAALPYAMTYLRYGIEQHPAGRLIDYHMRRGRPDDARKVALDLARRVPPSTMVDAAALQLRVSALGEMARVLADLGFPADAVALYGEAVAKAEQLSPDYGNYVIDPRQYPQQLRAGLETLLGRLDPAELAPVAGRIIAEAPSDPTRRPASGDARKAARSEQALDLLVLIHPRGLERARLRSLLAESLAACNAPQLAALDEPLEKLRQAHPEDLSPAIATALKALDSGESGRIGPALERLDRLVERTPLEPLPAGVKANARQRAEAARQVPLWLVARACDDRPDSANHRAIADRLSARALEAAARQAENLALMAMLREQGERALARGDRKGAEAAWTRMLETVVTPPQARPRPPVPGSPGSPPPASGPRRVGAAVRSAPTISVNTASYQDEPRRQPATPKTRATPKARTKGASPPALPILTLDRFEQAMQIARLAAARDLPDLSFRAVREALRAGPPIVPPNPNAEARLLRVGRSAMEENATDPVAPRVVANLVELEHLWQDHHAPPERVYEALRGVVLPPGRPAEIFLYASPPNPRAPRRAPSVGAMLADWSVRAGKADDLRKATDERRERPMAELPAAVLTVQLALAAGDDANVLAGLKALTGRLKRETLRSTAELACHAALPALNRPRRDFAAAAILVLDACTKGLEGNAQPEPLGSLLVVLARRQWQLGDVAGARKHLDAFIEATESYAGRLSGDASSSVRRESLARAASEYARAGQWADTWNMLGRYADTPAPAVGDPSVTDTLARAIRQLDSAAAGERYRILHDWTMPGKDRRSARILASPVARERVPDVFFGATTATEMATAPAVFSSTAAALIDAARRDGKLDALAAEARAAAEQKIENAEVLGILVELARGQGPKVAARIEARLAELIRETRERTARKPSTAVPAAPSGPGVAPRSCDNELVARSGIESDDPAIAALGRRMVAALLQRAEQSEDLAAIAGLRGALATADARRANAPQAVTASIPASWHATSVRPAQDNADGGSPAIWVSHQGHLVHPAGTDADLLVFDVPLTGTYELSVDAYAGPSAGSAILHNGYGILPAADDGSARIFAVGTAETLHVPWKLSRPDGFNRLTIQVTPGKVRYVVNGHLLHEDNDPAPVSPWLGLLTDRRGYGAWRNLTLKGSPTVVRQVPLIQGDRLTGWVCRDYGETQPPRRNDWASDGPGKVATTPGTPRRRPCGASRSRAAIDVDDYDWAARDGVIHGRRTTPGSSPVASAEADQSRLSYLRPLGDGDVVTYEFLYEPGRVMVHPALDRLAFLLEPDGVKLHWMTAGADDPSGLPADNAVDEPANRRGPRPIPLKPGDWNAVKLSLAGDRVAIELNGESVYERPMDTAPGRAFGLFRYKDRTSAQVRHIVLKGHWPDSIPDRLQGDLAAVDAGSDDLRRARHAIVGEGLYALEAGDVLDRARPLEPAGRYAMLADWVLPGPDHPIVRLEGDFAPSYPASPGSDTGLGGVPRSPAFEMLRAAHDCGKLDDLARRVEALKAEKQHDPFAASERGRLALLAMIQGVRGDAAAAGATIEALRSLLEKLPPDLDEWARWPELVVAERTVHRPELGRPPLALAELLAERARPIPVAGTDDRVPSMLWEVQVKHLLARAVTPDGRQRPWTPVTPTTARSRGEGWPFPLWSLQDDAFLHQPGHGDDMLYFAAPIRGAFAVDCEVTRAPGREIRLVYGGQIIGLKSDGKHLERSQIGRPLPAIAISPPVETNGEWTAVRLDTEGNRLIVSIDGRKILETRLPAECDPWLALLCPATEAGSARKVVISGQPRIPERLALSASPELSGWRADEYAETRSGEAADWEKRGEEIVGRLNDEIPGARQESVLRYHRPMLEDGRIAYEFFYDPAERSMVHPALDRLAFLLEPDGVRVHRLTDGAYERSGLAPDNLGDEPANRRGPTSLPLRPAAWNRLAVEIKGDNVLIELNGQAIYERSLEPTNGRAFGLFHYADATRARARNVTYEGHWPRSLP